MNMIKEFAPAKINLFLDVIRKREDGYHDLGTLFQTVNAGDTLTLELRKDGVVNLEYNKPQDYPKESDLVYKAALALKDYALREGLCGNETDLGVDLYLEKVMPLGAGLGGGSADAAAALRGLNRLWGLNLTAAVLEGIGAKLGADVPFLVQGGSALAEGIGERLTALKPLTLKDGEVLLIATPHCAVPTKDAYAGVPKSGEDRWESYKKASAYLDPQYFFNAFEVSVFPKYPLVEEMKAKFMELGAKCALMSGSGASVFGIFPSRESAEKASEAISAISRYRQITDFFTGFSA